MVFVGGKKSNVVIQQDNAPAHGVAFEAAVSAACKAMELNDEFQDQPPRSSDHNVLDLGFYNAIQSPQHKKVFEIDALIQTVSETFTKLEPSTLVKCFMTLQSVSYESVLKKGDNNYKIPHLIKDQQLRAGDLLLELACSKLEFAVATHALHFEPIVSIYN